MANFMWQVQEASDMMVTDPASFSIVASKKKYLEPTIYTSVHKILLLSSTVSISKMAVLKANLKQFAVNYSV